MLMAASYKANQYQDYNSTVIVKDHRFSDNNNIKLLFIILLKSNVSIVAKNNCNFKFFDIIYFIFKNFATSSKLGFTFSGKLTIPSADLISFNPEPVNNTN